VSRRIIVHSLGDAQAAVGAAASLGCGVTLVSARGAGAYTGPAWFKAVVDAAIAAHPGAAVDAVIDCADAAGTALAALRLGLGRVRFSGNAEARAALAQIAAAQGAVIEGADDAPALDLLDARDAAAACRAFLSETNG